VTAAELRTARERIGLTQTETADLLRVDLRTYQRWEAQEVPLPRWLNRSTATTIHRLYDARNEGRNG
jgi:transcriptional regulator with XRE-family HTH domain